MNKQLMMIIVLLGLSHSAGLFAASSYASIISIRSQICELSNRLCELESVKAVASEEDGRRQQAEISALKIQIKELRIHRLQEKINVLEAVLETSADFAEREKTRHQIDLLRGRLGSLEVDQELAEERQGSATSLSRLLANLDDTLPLGPVAFSCIDFIPNGIVGSVDLYPINLVEKVQNPAYSPQDLIDELERIPKETRIELLFSQKYGQRANVFQAIIQSKRLDLLKVLFEVYLLTDALKNRVYSFSDNPTAQAIAEGRDVNAEDNFGYRPFLQAMRDNRFDVIQLLLADPRVDVNATNIWGYGPSHAPWSDGRVDVVRLLLADRRVDVNAANEAGNPPLHEAVSNGCFDVIRLLLADRRVNVNATNKYGNTPLHEAISKGSFDVVRLLLADRRVNVNATNKYGNTPLHVAMRHNRIDIVPLLLADPRVNVNARNNYAQTPLFYVITIGPPDKITRLFYERNERDAAEIAAETADMGLGLCSVQ